jgi:hypothetical protein
MYFSDVFFHQQTRHEREIFLRGFVSEKEEKQASNITQSISCKILVYCSLNSFVNWVLF